MSAMRKFMEWMRGDPSGDFGPGPSQSKKPKNPDWFEKIAEQEIASYTAYSRVMVAAYKEAENHKSDKAPVRIIQRDAGHYEIQRLKLKPSTEGWEAAAHTAGAAFRENFSTCPVEVYVSVKADGRSEIMTFNVFDDAEAYLKRMMRENPAVTEYDFPPLTKRIEKKEPKS